jgi:hypothetical protein
VENCRCRQDAIRGHHIFDIRQADDPRFADHRRQDRTSETVKKVLDESNLEIAEVVRHWEISIRVIASTIFFECRVRQMSHGQEVFRTAFDLKLQDAFTRPSVSVLPDLLCRQRATPFNQC